MEFERTRYVKAILLERLSRIVEAPMLAPGNRLLDYGCGSCPYRSLFSGRFPEYVGADIAGNPEADLVLGPRGEIPEPDESFDCVLSSQVLEHVDDPRFYLAEAHRVLRPGGTLVLSTHGMWHYHPHPADYWRWTREGLEREIRRSGFEIATVQSVLTPESAVLQLWQDVTFERLPRAAQPLYVGLIQRLIGLIERGRADRLYHDASVYVVLARRADPA